MPYVTFVYDQISYLHSFRMLRLRHRVVVDDRHLDVADHQQVLRQFLVYLIYKEMMMVRHQCVVGNPHLLMVHLMQVVLHLDVLQILDEQNLDVIRSFLDEEHLDLQVVVVDAEPRHLLKMDCYLDEVDAEPHYLLKMDCYLDEKQVQLVMQVLRHQLHGLLRDLLPHALQLPLY
jgi:GTPase Era involved in 16S rRNA processing